MQCPNCRKIEKGHWLYANGRELSSDSDSGDEVTSETYDLISDLLRRSPFDGSSLLAFLDHEPEPTSFGDHPNSEHVPFYHHATADSSNVQVFDRTEPRNYVIEHQYFDNLPMLGVPNHPTVPFGIGVTRYDGSNQQSLRQSLPLLNWPAPRNGNSLIAPIGSSPPVASDARGHGHGIRGHVSQQTVPSSIPSSTYFPIGRRVWPSALSIASFIAASHEAEARHPHDSSLTGAANTQNSNIPNGDKAFDRMALWRPEAWGVTSSFVTGAANTPNSNPPNGVVREAFWRPEARDLLSGYLSRPATELSSMFRSENGYQRPGHDRIPPFF